MDSQALEIPRDTTAAVKPVAVIILNWNGAALLSEFLPSVVAYTPADLADVIVADNGSTDDSLELLRKEFPSVKVIAFDENYGFAQGYNRAIAMTDYQYTVLLNSDVAVKDDWLTPLYEYMERHPDVGACQPKLLSYREPEKFEYAGASGGFLDRNGYPYCRGRLFDTVETDSGQYDRPRADLAWATGAALMVHTALYREVGGLDADFFAHMEEIDLCWRIRLAGYRIAVVPDGKVFHLGGGSLSAGNPRKTYLNFRNNLLMLHKNLPDGVRGRKLLWRRLLDTVALLRMALTGDMKNARAVVRAHGDFRKMRKRYTVHPDRNLLKGCPDVLTGYFLRGKHTFDKISH